MRVQWCVDLPNPNQLDGEWVELEVFDRRKDAVNFIVKKIGLPRKAAKYFIARVEI